MNSNSLKNIKLTDCQKRVLKSLLSFVNDSDDRVFILKGYAGTGKTTLMRFLIDELSKQGTNYCLLASTGRAAKILANLSGSNGRTSTIHSMIYTFGGLNKEFDSDEKPAMDMDGQLYLVFNPVRINKNKTDDRTVYIVDEASMVSDVASHDITQAKFGDGRVLSELLAYDERPGSKFIFVGDPCQLPPVEESQSPALMKNYFRSHFGLRAQEAQLTEILRQKGSNGIVNASKQVRTFYENAPETTAYYGRQRLWGSLPFSQYKNIRLHADADDMMDKYVEIISKKGFNSAVSISRFNKECLRQSRLIRERLGMHSPQVQRGDLLMVVQNNLPTGLMNGDMVTVEKILPGALKRASLTFRKAIVRELFTGETSTTYFIEDIVHQERPNLNSLQQQALFVDFIERMMAKGISQKKNKDLFYDAMRDDPILNALRCSFGYVITCHKSQGGEWDDVFLQLPRNITLNPVKANYQWVYTAMTRARNTLHIVDDFFIV